MPPIAIGPAAGADAPSRNRRVNTLTVATDRPLHALLDGNGDAGKVLAHVQVRGPVPTDSAAAVASRSDANTPGCVICLDAEGELLQRGCCCRGDAGLAHLHCLVELAVHDEKSKNTFAAWHQCGTCKANFTGWVQHGLASTG